MKVTIASGTRRSRFHFFRNGNLFDLTTVRLPLLNLTSVLRVDISRCINVHDIQ